MLTISDGIPLEFCILLGGCAALQGLAEHAFDLPDNARLFVDVSYNYYEWEEYLRKAENLRVQVPREINLKRDREQWREIFTSLTRKYI